MGSILLARELPEEGGDTLFANMYLAFETLSRRAAAHARRHARRSIGSAHVFGAKGVNAQEPRADGRYGNQHEVGDDAVHPVVIRHPAERPQGALRQSRLHAAFRGLDGRGQRVRCSSYLYRHAARPEFTCRFRWHEGSMAFWDNRATWHYAANDYHGERRLMHRITVAGCKLEAAAS